VFGGIAENPVESAFHRFVALLAFDFADHAGVFSIRLTDSNQVAHDGIVVLVTHRFARFIAFLILVMGMISFRPTVMH
jgi:hypothetical protein